MLRSDVWGRGAGWGMWRNVQNHPRSIPWWQLEQWLLFMGTPRCCRGVIPVPTSMKPIVKTWVCVCVWTELGYILHVAFPFFVSCNRCPFPLIQFKKKKKRRTKMSVWGFLSCHFNEKRLSSYKCSFSCRSWAGLCSHVYMYTKWKRLS